MEKKTFKSDFVASIATLASGNILGYGISLILLPVLSRIYLPWQIGEYDLIISSGSMVLDLFSLGMLTAIMLPKDEDTAISICKLIVIVMGIFSTLAFIGVVLIFPSIQLFAIQQNYYFACALLYLYIVVNILQNTYYCFVNRKKLYKVLFWTPIVNAICNSGFSILFGTLGAGTLGYLLGTIIAYIANILLMSRFVKPLKGKISFRELRDTFIMFKTFPMVQMPANMISSISSQIPIQAMGRLFGSAVLGGYSMASKIMSIPVMLLAGPINKVYYKTASEKLGNGESIGEFSFKLLESNLKIALLPLIFLIIFGEPFLCLFLGESWSGTGLYLQLAGGYYLVQFCSSCFSGTFVLLDKKEINIIAASTRLLINLALFYMISAFSMPFFPAIAIYLTVDMIIQIVLLGVMFHFTEFKVKKYFCFIFKYIILIYSISIITIIYFQ